MMPNKINQKVRCVLQGETSMEELRGVGGIGGSLFSQNREVGLTAQVAAGKILARNLA